MRKMVSFIISVVLVFALAGCSGGPSKATIKYNLPSEPKTLDPQSSNDASSQTIVKNIFEGLCRLSEGDEVIPGVAKSYESNNDYTSFKFNLRDDAMWSDGKTKVTANDFVFGFRRAAKLISANYESPVLCVKNAKGIQENKLDISKLGVYAIDDYTLEVDLEYPYKNFPKLTSEPSFMPCNEKFFNDTSSQYGVEGNYILSNGPFALKSKYGWDHGKSIKLFRSSQYKGETDCIPSGIEFTIGKEQDTFDALLTGATDAGGINASQVQQAKDKNMNLTFFQDTTYGISFNLDNEVFKNEDIRIGFTKAIDKEYVLSSLPQNSKIAYDILPPLTSYSGLSYRDQAGSDFCIKKSDDAGIYYNRGVSEYMAQHPQLKKMPEISILCLNDNETKAIVSRLLEVWNKNLGAYFSMNPVSNEDLQKAIQTGNYQMTLMPVKASTDGPYSFLSMFSSGSKSNAPSLKSPEYDNLLNNAKASDDKKGLEYYVQAEKYINDNAVFYPMYYEDRCFASASNVSKVIFYPYNSGVSFKDTIKKK